MPVLWAENFAVAESELASLGPDEIRLVAEHPRNREVLGPLADRCMAACNVLGVADPGILRSVFFV